jgi:hypothetical protein
VATTILAPHPNGDPAAPWSVDENVETVTEKVNEALQVGEKFVTVKVDGKDRSFVAAEIRSIFEE